MFIKRNATVINGTSYTATLLVQGKRVPLDRLPGRPQAGQKSKTKVVHETLCNLSKLPPDLIGLIEAYCKKVPLGPLDSTDQNVSIGPAYGAIAAAYALARELGIPQALGFDRRGKLAIFLVLARLIHQGSRLSAVRWAKDQALDELLDLGPFEEQDLYDTLGWIEDRHESLEVALARQHLKGQASPSTFLYDVTSSYLEGQCCELAAPGYNRDGKRYKKQIVIGLLTAVDGEPLAIRVFEGNTGDTQTLNEAIKVVADRLEVRNLVFVGDRGMIKSAGRKQLKERGFRFLTALTNAQVRKLIKAGELSLDQFRDEPQEASVSNGRRLILRRNPKREARDRQRRQNQLSRVQGKVDQRNAKLRESARAQPAVSRRQANSWLQTYRLHRFVDAKLEGREVSLVVDEKRLSEVSLLDGCYVLETDVNQAELGTQAAHARYKDLEKVERNFRKLKTTVLEIRPLYLRKAKHIRGHALISLLALKILRRLEERVKGLNLSAQDALERLQGVRLVSVGVPGFELWRLPESHREPQREVLAVLPNLPPPMLSLTNQRSNTAQSER